MRPVLAKTAVVTGGGSGLGRSLSVELGSRGWSVGVLDLDLESAEETAELLMKAGGEGEAMRCDVRNAVELQTAADHYHSLWGPVGILFNNAGIGAGGMIEEIPIDEWERTVDTNLWGVIHGCRAFIPGMKRYGAGHIVNTGSIGAWVALPEVSPYCVSKAGIIALSETLASELAPFGIGVTVICPSFFKTNILATTRFSDEFQRELLEVAFAAARMECDEVARRVLRAVEKNRLYALPQASAKLSWANKRIAPVLMVRQWGWLNRMGWLQPFLKRVVRGGW